MFFLHRVFKLAHPNNSIASSAPISPQTSQPLRQPPSPTSTTHTHSHTHNHANSTPLGGRRPSFKPLLLELPPTKHHQHNPHIHLYSAEDYPKSRLASLAPQTNDPQEQTEQHTNTCRVNPRLCLKRPERHLHPRRRRRRRTWIGYWRRVGINLRDYGGRQMHGLMPTCGPLQQHQDDREGLTELINASPASAASLPFSHEAGRRRRRRRRVGKGRGRLDYRRKVYFEQYQPRRQIRLPSNSATANPFTTPLRTLKDIPEEPTPVRISPPTHTAANSRAERL